MTPPLRGIFNPFFSALIIWGLLLSCPASAWAQNLVLDNLVVDNQAGSLMVRFGLEVEGVHEIALGVENGVTVAMECEARLYREGGWFGDDLVSEARYDSALAWNSLDRVYEVKVPGREIPYENKSLAEVLKEAWGHIDLDMGSWEALERDNEYSLRLETRLRQKDVPKWLKGTLFFMNWDVVPSAEYRLDFTY